MTLTLAALHNIYAELWIGQSYPDVMECGEWAYNRIVEMIVKIGTFNGKFNGARLAYNFDMPYGGVKFITSSSPDDPHRNRLVAFDVPDRDFFPDISLANAYLDGDMLLVPASQKEWIGIWNVTPPEARELDKDSRAALDGYQSLKLGPFRFVVSLSNEKWLEFVGLHPELKALITKETL